MQITPSEYDHFENFHKDRNVILKKVQNSLLNLLTGYLAKVAIEKYKVLFNPLGLIDETYQKILDYEFEYNENLTGIYENLSVIYRYKHGDNQLEIIWDGKSHEQKYQDEWVASYEQWVKRLTDDPSFVRGVLQLTALHSDHMNTYFIQNYLKGRLNDFFEIKVLKRNGIKKVILKTKLDKAS